MASWQEEFLGATQREQCEHAVFQRVETAARALGFEHCAFGLRAAQLVSYPKTIILNNFAASWWARYVNADYLQADLAAPPGRRTHSPPALNDKIFASTRQLWDDARCCGLRVRSTASSLEAMGVAGLLTLARAQPALSAAAFASQEIKLCWLVNVSHQTLYRIFASRPRVVSL